MPDTSKCVIQYTVKVERSIFRVKEWNALPLLTTRVVYRLSLLALLEPLAAVGLRASNTRRGIVSFLSDAMTSFDTVLCSHQLQETCRHVNCTWSLASGSVKRTRLSRCVWSSARLHTLSPQSQTGHQPASQPSSCFAMHSNEFWLHDLNCTRFGEWRRRTRCLHYRGWNAVSEPRVWAWHVPVCIVNVKVTLVGR